ncbi:glycosyltransferase family 2 protein [candidate division KSB1 bacterium]|nr:glycosyltransferase family 2 protein [candidate division KSB1 bacterium]
MATNGMDLSIIIVTFNHATEIVPCLNALLKSDGDWRAEIILVDNASTDDTRKIAGDFMHSQSQPRFQFRLLPMPQNLGFTDGTNQGIEASSGAYLLLLNPDTQVTTTALSRLMALLAASPQVGMVAPQLRFPDQTIQPSCRRFPQRRDVLWRLLGLTFLFPKSEWFNRWQMPAFDHQTRAAVEQPQGAALMTTRPVLSRLGLLDPQFPMFFSDVDWCYRCKALGLAIMFEPTAVVIHTKGTSIYRHRARMIWSSHRSFYDYFRKYRRGLGNTCLNFIVGGLLWIMAVGRVSAIGLRNRLSQRANRSSRS